MKALVVLSALIAVVLSAPSVDKRYVRPGAYVPWQPPRYSYNPVRNVYPRWYQSTITPNRYEASTLSPWLSQGKAKFSFGSALNQAVTVKPETEQSAKIAVESTPAVPKVPAGFGVFHFGKKLTPSVVATEEIKPIETIAPEVKITETVVESGSAEASLKSISNEESVQTSNDVSGQIKPVVVETESVQSLPEIKLSTPVLVEDSKQSEVIITSEIKSEETLKELNVEESNEKTNKTSVSDEKYILEAKPSPIEEPKPSSIVENQSISEIKSEVIAPVVVKKKHGFSFSYNPSSNVYNRNSLPLYSQVQPSVASVPEIKPIVIQVTPAVELNPTLPAIGESDKASIVPASLSVETVQATTENIQSIDDFVVPTLDISEPIIQYNSVPSQDNAEILSTIEYAVPTADISQPIIQYVSSYEENASTTVESAQATTEASLATSDYASEYSPINSESIDVLLSSSDSTIEPTHAEEVKEESYDYTPTESEASTTENAPATTESSSNEFLQNDFEPALTTSQSQPENIESVSVIQSSAPLVSEASISSVQSESAAVLSSQSLSYSSTPSIVKKKHGFSFSYNPSGYVFNKEASFVYKPSSELSVPEIQVTPAVTTLAPSTTQYLQPVVSTVIPAANIWSNFYNTKQNSYSFAYNPSFSYFNRQQYYQPQFAVPSAAPVVSIPAGLQSSASSPAEIAPLTSESIPTAPEYVESTTSLFEDLSEDVKSTESSLPESTTLSIEYGTTVSQEQAAVSEVDQGYQSAIVESSSVAAEALSLKDKEPALTSSSFVVPPIAPVVLPVANTWSNSYNSNKNSYSFSYFPSFSYFNKPAYQQQIAIIAPEPVLSASPITSAPNSALIEPLPSIDESSTQFVPEIAESSTTFNEIVTDNAEVQYSTTESYSDEPTTLSVESSEYLSTTQTASASVELVSAAIESSIKEALKEHLAIGLISKETSVATETAAAVAKPENDTKCSSVTKDSSVTLESSSTSASSSPIVIESAPVAVASVQAIPVPLYVKEVTKASPPAALPAFQPSFVTKKHGFSFSYKPSGNFYNKPVIASAAPAKVESSSVIASAAPAIVESSPVIASAAPAIVESSPVIVSAAPVIVESSVITSAAPAIVEAAPAIVEAAPAIVKAAPTIVESSPVIVSAASATVESSPVIASDAPAVAKSSQEEVSSQTSLLTYLFNAVKSAILEEKATEKVVEAKPEIYVNPSVVAEPQTLNSEADLSSQNDFVVKVSPKSSELKQEAEFIHDLRLGN